jgi:hypothetical protein
MFLNYKKVIEHANAIPLKKENNFNHFYQMKYKFGIVFATLV